MALIASNSEKFGINRTSPTSRSWKLSVRTQNAELEMKITLSRSVDKLFDVNETRHGVVLPGLPEGAVYEVGMIQAPDQAALGL